jgi:hypothetical protein
MYFLGFSDGRLNFRGDQVSVSWKKKRVLNRAPVTIRDSQRFYIILSSYSRGNLKVVNCPECGKPLKRDTGKTRYCCENSACSVIFVRHPDKQSIMEITHEARARS